MRVFSFSKFILVVAVFISLNIFNNSYSQNEDKFYKKIDLFSEVLEKIQNDYWEEIDQLDAMDSAINGLLQSLDPYSSYMSPKIFEESQTETSGEFGGLGIEVGMEHGVVKVISPIDNSPASRGRSGVKEIFQRPVSFDLILNSTDIVSSSEYIVSGQFSSS